MKKTILFYAAVIIFPAIMGMDISRAQVHLNIQTGVQLSWTTSSNDNYQVQWSSGSGSAWNNLGALLPGNGITNTYNDMAASGSRQYQVLQIVPATARSSASPTNGGFETGSGTSAADWTVDTAVGGPVYGIRTNDNPHSGSYNFEVQLASTGAGPVVQFNQAGIPVTGGTTIPFTFYADALAGSQGYGTQWRILWNAGGDTGYQSFIPSNNVYGVISNSVSVPASATSGILYFHFAGAASTSHSATIDIDDVALGNGVSNPGNPAVTNVLSVGTMPIADITWPTVNGVQYQPESTTNLQIWNTNLPVIIGSGGTNSLQFPLTNNSTFFRVFVPPVVVMPPTDVQQVASGMTNTIGLAWDGSSTPGVIGYEILYGPDSNVLSNFVEVGDVVSVIIPDLTPGQTYYLAIITL